ncbi:hypothetical protein EV421DRAFT_1742907 [Armillaria borealis]|uniref:Uncharacterized protein n=1 Tax=Armillaria borealis TaxID=47425 RepID=A0AA39ME89_9AGAR|nr:hypothetical protein EV421DRAFT_1742907 [Armillaria borealis]
MWLSVLPSFQQGLCRRHRARALVNTQYLAAPLQKASRNFQLSLSSFQHAQRASAGRQRTVVEGVRMAVDYDHHPVSHRTSSYTRNPLSKKRENDTREIESGIHELAEIYRDLGMIQGEMLVTSTPSSVALDISRASEELATAAHQIAL